MARIVPRVWLGADSMITSLGFSTEEALEGILAGRSGCVRTNDPSLYREPFVAGTVDGERLDALARDNGLESYTRLERLFILAAGDVLRRSGVDPADGRTLFIISTTKGNIDLLEGAENAAAVEGAGGAALSERTGGVAVQEGTGNAAVPKGAAAIDPRAFIYTMAGRIARHFGAANPPLVISNACISGVASIIVGTRLIKEGLYDNIIVAGGDLVTKFVATGFHAFRSVSPALCRPYDARRDGLTLGEGCAAVLLTSDARLAGEIPVEVASGAISNDANHISGPSRTGDGLWLAIRDAMRQAALPATATGFINGHGTATVFNDEMESKAFGLAGLGGLPLNSLKPWFGHTLGASGVIEAVISAHGLRRGVVFGTPGFEAGDTSCPLDVSAAHRETALDYCLKTASGFGGCNAAVVLKKRSAEAEPLLQPLAEAESLHRPISEINIRETARWSLSPNGEPFAERIRGLYRELGEPDMKFQKMDSLAKLGYVAAAKIFETAALAGRYEPERIGVVLANRSASLDTDLRHQGIIDGDPPEGASPAVFVYTLPNVASGEISIRNKIKGETTFFIQDTPDIRFLEEYSRMLLKNGYLSAVIFGWCELLGEEYEADFWLIEIK